uniref:Uncharacterized protein n=1 Tax=Sphaerodactylus townsendi TaxID=933632 RepID=A0ACB8EFZ2_9SAUR
MHNPEPSNGKQDSEGQSLERPIKTEAELTHDGNDVTDVSQIKIVQVNSSNCTYGHDCPFQSRVQAGLSVALTTSWMATRPLQGMRPDMLSHSAPQEEPWLLNSRHSEERQGLRISRETEGPVEPSRALPERELDPSDSPRGLSLTRNGIGTSDSCDSRVTEHLRENPPPRSPELELSDALPRRSSGDLLPKPKVALESRLGSVEPPAKESEGSAQCGLDCTSTEAERIQLPE